MNVCAALIMFPQEGVGGCIPIPRNERDASYMIALGIPRVTSMFIVLVSATDKGGVQ